MVLVLGATGYVGGRLVPRLLNAGYRLRVLSRSRARIDALQWSGDVEVLEGDAADREALARAMKDVDIIYFLVHSMSSGKNFARVERTIARSVAVMSKNAGVSRIIYLGGLAPDIEVSELSPHLASRREVGEILLDSGVPTIALQAGVVIGSDLRHLK